MEAKKPSSGRSRGRRAPDEDPLRIADSLESVSARLGVGNAHAVAVVFGHWEDLVGQAVAAHVHPLRVEGTTLHVGVDHPAWVTQIRHLSPQILERIEEACTKDEAPKRIEVRVIR